MKKILIVIILLAIIKQNFAQSPKHKVWFNSINDIGTVMGENGNNITFQTINGITTKSNWLFGIGVGYDPYQVKSIPVFVDVRKYLGKKNWQPFVYFDGGLNINLHNHNYPKDSYTFKNSAYYDWGMGINKSISKTAKFFISAGYNIKQFKYNYQDSWAWDTGFPTLPSRYNFNFNRWIIKLGFEL